MNDKEKAEQRFIFKPEEIKVTFIPQCTTCEYNISKDTCKKFQVKPKDYKENVVKCPEYKKK